MVMLLGVQPFILRGMIGGEKTLQKRSKHCKKYIGPLQIDPKSWNVAEKQIDLFFLPCGGCRCIIYIYTIYVCMYIIYVYSKREGERKREREIDRQIDRKIDRQIDRYIDRQIDRQMDSQIDRQIDRKIDRQTNKQIDSDRYLNPIYNYTYPSLSELHIHIHIYIYMYILYMNSSNATLNGQLATINTNKL